MDGGDEEITSTEARARVAVSMGATTGAALKTEGLKIITLRAPR
jgi:hypothetical protein